MNRHKLIYFMSIRNMNNATLAEKVGVTDQTISNIRRGSRKCSEPLSRLIAIALETTPEALKEGEDAAC